MKANSNFFFVPPPLPLTLPPPSVLAKPRTPSPIPRRLLPTNQTGAWPEQTARAAAAAKGHAGGRHGQSGWPRCLPACLRRPRFFSHWLSLLLPGPQVLLWAAPRIYRPSPPYSALSRARCPRPPTPGVLAGGRRKGGGTAGERTSEPAATKVNVWRRRRRARHRRRCYFLPLSF